MEPLARRNIEIIIDMAKQKKLRPKAIEKVNRYIEMLGNLKEEYKNFANEYMKKQWRE